MKCTNGGGVRTERANSSFNSIDQKKKKEAETGDVEISQDFEIYNSDTPYN